MQLLVKISKIKMMIKIVILNRKYNLLEIKTPKDKELKSLENNDFEFNEFNYEDSLKKEKSTFVQLYLSFIKTKHLLIF